MKNFFLNLTILCLPIIDWRWYPMGGYVRPLSFIFILLGLFSLFFNKFPKFTLPANKPFRIFGLIIIVSLLVTVINYAYLTLSNNSLSFLGYSFHESYIKGSLTVFAGFLSYYYFTDSIKNINQVVKFYKWILWVGFLMGLSVILQHLAILGFSWAKTIYNFSFSFLNYRSTLDVSTKAYGWSPEGSFLADYLIVILLPPIFAAIDLNISLFNRQKKTITFIEVSMFILFFISLIMSASRIGLLAGVFLIIFLIISKIKKHGLRSIGAVIAIFCIFSVTTFAFSSIVVSALSSVFISPDSWQETNNESNAVRATNIATAIKIFWAHPMGVGIGGYPFYFEKNIPDWFLWVNEIQNSLGTYNGPLNFENRLPNAKAFFPRILCETGIVGGTIFIIFILSLIKCIRKSKKMERSSGQLMYIRKTMIYSVLGMTIVSISNDSFALIYYYFIFAICGKLTDKMFVFYSSQLCVINCNRDSV